MRVRTLCNTVGLVRFASQDSDMLNCLLLLSFTVTIAALMAEKRIKLRGLHLPY